MAAAASTGFIIENPLGKFVSSHEKRISGLALQQLQVVRLAPSIKTYGNHKLNIRAKNYQFMRISWPNHVVTILLTRPLYRCLTLCGSYLPQKTAAGPPGLSMHQKAIKT